MEAKLLRLLLIAAILGLGTVWPVPHPALAALLALDISVESTADSPGQASGGPLCQSVLGPCTLRAALMFANAHPGVGQNPGVTIHLPAGTFILTRPGTGSSTDETTGSLKILHGVIIQGAGAASTIINGNRDVVGEGVFQISVAANSFETVEIQGVTITNGGGNTYYGGGGIHNNNAALLLYDSEVSGNSATSSGGGIDSLNGFLALTRTKVYNNLILGAAAGVRGAGLTSYGENAILDTSEVFNNHSLTDGGGLANVVGNLTLKASNVYSNTAAGNGGGIWNSANGAAFLINSTITENAADGNGGGLWNNARMNLYNTTVTGNTADAKLKGAGFGGGIFNIVGQSFRIDNSIIADNIGSASFGGGIYHADPSDCFGPVYNGGYNLMSWTGSGCVIQNVPLLSTSAGLGPFANNGGPLFTQALLTGSPALAAGDPTGCKDDNGMPISVDERGSPRPTKAACDLGAFQHNPRSFVYLPLIEK